MKHRVVHLHLGKTFMFRDGKDMTPEYEQLVDNLLKALAIVKARDSARTTDDDKGDEVAEHWVTIHGTHVKINGVGEIVIGPKEFVGKKLSEIGNGPKPEEKPKPEDPIGPLPSVKFSGKPEEPAAPGKPGTVSSKGVKMGVHELLSSGHEFSTEELQKITGATTPKQISDAIAMLKNPKWAGSKGTLEIVKNKNGNYSVKPKGEVVIPDITPEMLKGAPPEMTMAEINAELKAAKTALPEPSKTAAPATPLPDLTEGLKAPSMTSAGPMPKHEADHQYETYMDNLIKNAKMETHAFKFMTEGSPEYDAHMKKVALMFKESKANAMAKWKANVSGEPIKPIKPQQVFESDKILIKGLSTSISPAADKELMNQWKKNTGLEKSGVLVGPEAQAAMLKKLQEIASGHANAELKPSLVPVSATPVTTHSLKAPTPEELVPDTHKQISADDFSGGQSKFSQQMNFLKGHLQQTSSDSVGNKKTVESRITSKLSESQAFQNLKKLRNNKYEGAFGLEATLIQSWASTSGDSHPVSVANQLAVRDVFNMDHAHVHAGNMSSMLSKGPAYEDEIFRQAAQSLGIKADTPEHLEQVKAGLKDFALAQYHATQDYFKEAGITEVYIARGMKYGSSTANAKPVAMKLQPASSFSANFGTAKQFASNHSVFLAKVPVSQVLSTYQTGFGCTSEHELTVLNHKKLEAIQIGTSNAPSLSAATQHVAQVSHEWTGGAKPVPVSKPGTGPGMVQPATKPKAMHVLTKPPSTAVNTYTKKAYEHAQAGNLEGAKLVQQAVAEKVAAGSKMPKSTAYLAKVVAHLEAKQKPANPVAGVDPQTGLPTVKALKAAWGVADPDQEPADFDVHTAIHAPAHIASHSHFDPEWYVKQKAQGKTDFQIGKNLAAKKFASKKAAEAQAKLKGMT